MRVDEVEVGEVVTMTDLRVGSSFPVRVVEVADDGKVIVDDVDSGRRWRVGAGFLTRPSAGERLE